MMKRWCVLMGVLWFPLTVLAQPAVTGAPDGKLFKYPELAATPPMGWNSWNTFGCKIDEALIRHMADVMVDSGMRDAGYRYVNIDDCWQGERDDNGFIQADPARFPSGIKALADYVHGKGLKLGIYSDAGDKTCAGYSGSQGHEYQDAMQYARWGVDYLKYDWCNTEGRDPLEAYRTMGKALLAAGRPIVLSICEWGDGEPWKWAQPVGHLWRTTGDITNCWDCVVGHGNWNSFGIMRILDQQEDLRGYAGPHGWNDPDMMEVGNLASVGENRAHFAMWAMLAAPLIAGNDLRVMSKDTRSILINPEVIAVDQDTLGILGFAYRREPGLEVWFRPLADGDWAMALLNRGDVTREVRFDWTQEYVEDAQTHHTLDLEHERYVLRDLFAARSAGDTGTPLKVKVPAHDVALYRLTPERH